MYLTVNGSRMRVHPIERFLAKVERQDSCWLWTGGKTTAGYGVFYFEGKLITAHRFSHMHYLGPIPVGLEIDHLCKTVSCVNPAHLEAVTRQENLLRSSGLAVTNAAKTHCINGHEFNEVNTLFASYGRKCRVCGRENKAKQTKRKKETKID